MKLKHKIGNIFKKGQQIYDQIYNLQLKESSTEGLLDHQYI